VVMIVLASIIMGAMVIGLDSALSSLVRNPSLGVRALSVLGIIGVSAIVYFAIVIVTGAIDRNELKAAFKRKRRAKDEEAAPLEQ
jgi:putative peptidoglycan lipid II flippase